MAAIDLLQGTLDLLILRALQGGPLHGLGVARRVEQLTGGTFQVRAGSLFPALHRLEERGWLTAEWGLSENKRRARYYSLTRTGRSQFKTAVEHWWRLSGAINLSLQNG